MRGKKLLSLIISIAMTLSMFSGLAMTSAQAAVGDAANNVWTASAADAEVLADTVLVDDEKGTLTTLFDFTLSTETTDAEGVTTPVSETVGDRTFTAYVSHPSQNGGFNSDGTLRTGYTTLLSYTPKADGVLTAYFLSVASNKNVCIIEDGAAGYKTGGAIVYTPGTGSMSVSAELTAGKTYYMFVDGSKGRFAAVDFEVGATYEQPTLAPSTPAPTVDPNAKVYSWTVSDADVNKKAGDLLMTGLSLVSDNAGTNSYVTALNNGDLVGGVATGSALMFVAPENGTISVTFKDLGNVDNYKTAHIYDATAGKEVASYTTQGLAKETFDLSAGVAEGSTYYIYANGTRARYSAATFTPGEAPKDYSWTVSESDIGKVAGTALMEGLTLVADNSSESDKYVTALDNGKIEKDEEGVASVTGAALKFVAPEDGKLEVTMIDVGSENEDGSIKVVNPVIYDYESGNDVFSYENTAAKETVVLSADVEAGKTYYAIATGTKGRFSAAKFTPAGAVTETQAPATDAPATDAPATSAPAVDAISYADGTVTVTLADVETAVLINASYADGALSSVNTYDLTFTDGIATAAVEAAEGSKLMVWDCLDCMQPLCASYTVAAKADETTSPDVTDAPATTAPDVTVAPTEDPSGLPADVIFRADDAAFDTYASTWSKETVSTEVTTVGDLTIGLNYYIGSKSATYTHNGTEYKFTRSWVGGTGNSSTGTDANRNLFFQPKGSCVVTVVFDGNGSAGRVQNIAQNGTVLATAPSESGVTVLQADILDPTYPVVVYGGGSNKNVYAIFVEYYDATPDKTVTGTITNSTGDDLSAETIVFTNTADATDVVEMAYTENYSVNLTKGATYSISVKGKEDTICPTISTAEVTVTKDRNALIHNIELVKIGEVTVTGNVFTLSSHDLRTPAKAYDEAIGASLNFTKEGDTTPVTASVNADGTYSVSLQSNENYTVALANAEGYTLSTLSASYSLPGGVENPTKNVLIMKDTADSVEYKATVTVGADKDYPTVSDAVAAIRKMTRTTERVEIVVDPGTYTEQVYLDVSNVTLKSADASNPALISWYYGIGYEYYSAAKDGWYNADAAVAQTAKGTAQKWGGTVYVRGSNFLAENIKFQSSFNLEIVPQELADGVAPGGNDAKNWDRTAEGADPKSRAAVERAAAMLVEGANAEFYKCSFQSSQDTLWTGSSAAYFKECDIYGGTDYIFGGNSVVFDTCNLIWQGYSDQQVGGYITACKNSSTEDNGYLMLNCTVKNNTADSGQQFAQGGYGRNWGGVNCKVIFLNTKLEGDAKVAGWTKMGGELAQSNLYVVNTTDADGNAVELTSADLPCGELSAEDIAAIDPYDYFNDWTPVHYEGEVPENTTIASLNLADGSLFSEDEKTNKTVVSFGVDASGNRVAADSEDAVVVFNNINYHNDHGINPGSGSISVKVTGPTEITVGACTYGSDVTVKNGEEVIKVLKNGIGCGSRDASKKLVTYYKGTEPTTITITGGGYIPFVTFKGVALEDIPNEATATFTVGDATGIAPADKKIEIGETFKAPKNFTLYKEGYTLTGWSDGTTTYAVGSDVAIEADTEFTPVFTANPTITEAYTVTFDFQQNNGAPSFQWQNSQNFWIGQATVGDSFIDVKLDVDTNNGGKLNNTGWGDWAQCNDGTTFTLPATEGTVVTVGDVYTAAGGYTINGVSKTGGNQSETLGAGTTTATIVIGNGNGSSIGYIRSITVAFPVPTTPAETTTPVETEKPVETTDPTVAPTDPTETTAPVETEEPAETTAPTAEPVEEVTEPIVLTASQAANGVSNANSEVFTFESGVDSIIKATLADSDDPTKVAAANFATYQSYIGKTDDVYFENVSLSAGNYTVYYISYGGGQWWLPVSGMTYNDIAGAVSEDDSVKQGIKFATGNSATESFIYEFGLTVPEGGVANGKLTFDDSHYGDEDQWLPDLFCVVIVPEGYTLPTGTVTFSVGETAAEGQVPAALTDVIGSAVTIPANRSLYKEGYTLTGWTDGTNTYTIGSPVKVTGNVTLTPVFTENTAKLGDAETSATFYFGKSNGAAEISIQGASNPTAVVVAQATIGDDVIDVKLDADATAGKLNNAGRTDQWAQINSGTIISIPAFAGSVVGMEFFTDSSYTYNGETVTAGQTFEVTVAESGNAAFTIQAGGYISKVTVTYPAATSGDEG